MSALSDYAEEKFADWIGGNANMPATSSRYLALFDDDPTDANTGNEVTADIRVAGRLGITFSSPTNGQISNASQISFGNSNNDASVTHFGIYDAASGGNLIVHGQLSSPKTIQTGDELLFEAGSIIIAAQ